MKLDVIVNGQRGVINITSEQFIIEDLKTHVCKKLELSENDFKVKVACGNSPSIELIKTPNLSMRKETAKTFNIDDVIADFSKYHKDIKNCLSNKLNLKINLIMWANNDFFHVVKGDENLAVIGKGDYIAFSDYATDNEKSVIRGLFRKTPNKDNKVKYSKLEKEAITQLQNKWNGKAMDCDYDINEKHPSLDKKLYESYNLSNRFRRVFKWFMENNKDYFFVCLDNTSVYLKINKENKELFLFDGASEESVNQFMKREV